MAIDFEHHALRALRAAVIHRDLGRFVAALRDLERAARVDERLTWRAERDGLFREVAALRLHVAEVPAGGLREAVETGP